MKIVQYIISVLLMTNLLKLNYSLETASTFDWYWNLFTGLVGLIYFVLLLTNRDKK